MGIPRNNTGVYKSEILIENYNVSKLQILSAVYFLTDQKEEATTEAICGLTLRPIQSVCHLAARYTNSKLLARKIRTKKNRLVKSSIYRYALTEHGEK